MLATDSREHLPLLVGEDGEGVAIFLPKRGIVPLICEYDQVSDKHPVGAVDQIDVFSWLQEEFLGSPTWGAKHGAPGDATPHLDTGGRQESKAQSQADSPRPGRSIPSQGQQSCAYRWTSPHMDLGSRHRAAAIRPLR